MWGGHRNRGGIPACIDYSDDVAYGTSPRLIEGPAGQPLARDVQEGQMSEHVTGGNRVADTVECHLRAFPLHEQGIFHDLALDGVSERSDEPARVNLSFYQIVLCTLLQRPCGQRLVVQPRQYHE